MSCACEGECVAVLRPFISDLLSPFLTGRMLLREPIWKYPAKLVGS